VRSGPDGQQLTNEEGDVTRCVATRRSLVRIGRLLPLSRYGIYSVSGRFAGGHGNGVGFGNGNGVGHGNGNGDRE
jgi:hypothetical protein